MTSAGLFTRSMTFAIVKVFPEPVTPSRVWWRFPSLTPRARFSIAPGWPPCGVKPETISNRPSFGSQAIRKNYQGAARGASLNPRPEHTTFQVSARDEDENPQRHSRRASVRPILLGTGSRGRAEEGPARLRRLGSRRCGLLRRYRRRYLQAKT